MKISGSHRKIEFPFPALQVEFQANLLRPKLQSSLPQKQLKKFMLFVLEFRVQRFLYRIKGTPGPPIVYDLFSQTRLAISMIPIV